MNYRKSFLEELKTVKRIITPWRIKVLDFSPEYKRGWNDCIKQLNKNYKTLIKKLEEE